MSSDCSSESSGTPMLYAMIDQLTVALSHRIDELKAFHIAELAVFRELYNTNIQKVVADFENRWSCYNHEQLNRILKLEEQIRYLKELVSSQRIMMEDNLGYTRELEEKLSALYLRMSAVK